MVAADWVAIVAVLAVCAGGAFLGFGKGIKFFTGGIFGIIISIVVCYWVGGLILDLKFVQEILNKFTAALTDKNGFCDFLLKIRIDIIVYYVALFIIVQLLRVLIVYILKHIVESDNVVFKIINRTLGAIFFLIIFTLIVLTVFQIIHWIGGSTAAGFRLKLDGSVFKLDKLFEHNPLLSLPKMLTRAFK